MSGRYSVKGAFNVITCTFEVIASGKAQSLDEVIAAHPGKAIQWFADEPKRDTQPSTYNYQNDGR